MAGKAGKLMWVGREIAGVRRSGTVRRCDQTQGQVRQVGGAPQQGRWSKSNLGLGDVVGCGAGKVKPGHVHEEMKTMK